MGKSMSCLKQLKFHFCTVFIIIFPFCKQEGTIVDFFNNFEEVIDIWQISSVQSLSRVWLFATPWIAARQASLSITNSQSSLKLMSIESVMPSSHLILCRPLFLLPPIPPSIRVFSNKSILCIEQKHFHFSLTFTHSFILFFFFFWPNGMWDLSSLTRNWTPGPQQWNHRFLTPEQPENSQGVIDIHLIHTCSYQNTVISFFETSIKYALSL